MRTPLTAIVIAGVCVLFVMAWIPVGVWPFMWVLPVMCAPVRLTDDGREHSLMRRELKQLTDARIR